MYRRPELLLAVRRGAGRSLRTQLEEALREAIRSGGLRAGDALPPSRVLAGDLGVARGVVVEAYGQLAAEGWLDARPGRGTRVARTSTPRAQSGAQTPVPRPRFDFRPGVPDVAAFPRGEWIRSLTHAVQRAPASRLLYPPAKGTVELRQELAAYLGRVRGVVAGPEEIVICAGVSQALHLLAEDVMTRGQDSFAMEDPNHFGERDELRARGLRLVPIPVDGDGIDVERLARSGARTVLVTPAHQFPTGVVMGPGRRTALAAWAADGEDRLVVEDDYDAEFRYDRHPIGVLQALAPARAVYLGSVSKTLAPGLRLGWIVAPRPLAERLAERKRLNDLGSPALDQLALAHFLGTGAYDRHIRRMRQRYRERRNALVDALAHHLPDVTVEGAAAGIHLVATLPPDVEEERVVAGAAARSVNVEGLARFVAGRTRPPALVLGYAALTPSALEEATRELAEAIREARATRQPATALARVGSGSSR